MHSADVAYNHPRLSGVFTSYSGAEIVPVIDMPGRLQNPIVIGSIHTITYSTHSEITPVRLLGSRRVSGFSRGPRTVAGTLIFTVFDEDAVRKLGPEYMDGVLIDEMPPFNINVVCRNDGGGMSRYAILGVRLVDSGMVMSIDNIITENTISYIAEDMVPLKSITDYSGSSRTIKFGAATGSEQELSGGSEEQDGSGRGRNPDTADGVVVLSGQSGEISEDLEESLEYDFSCDITVKKLVLHIHTDGTVKTGKESVPDHEVRVYRGEYSDWITAGEPIDVDEAERLLSCRTDVNGVVEFAVSDNTEATTLTITVVVAWFAHYYIRNFVLERNQRLAYEIELPIAATVGGSQEQSWAYSSEVSADLPDHYIPPKYIWMFNNDGSKALVTIDDQSNIVAPRYGYEYSVQVVARCFYAATGESGEMVRVPVDGEQLQASLHVVISYDNKTPYYFSYPIPIAKDGTVSASLCVVGYLQYVELEYVPVGHVHTSIDAGKAGYYFNAFHIMQYPDLHEFYGTCDKPGIVDFGDIVFHGVIPKEDDRNVYFIGTAGTAAGVCPPGSEVAVQLRWGDDKDAKCFASTRIPTDGVWYLPIELPVSVGLVKRVYVEYRAPQGYAIRKPYTVDGISMIPADSRPELPFNIMSLLSGYEDPHIVFYPVWPDEYADGLPPSEECSVPATVRVSGQVLTSNMQQITAPTIVKVAFMAMTADTKQAKRFSRYALLDTFTSTFELLIPPNKQLLEVSAHAAGYRPYSMQWPYLDKAPEKYSPEEAVLADQRRKALAQLRNGLYAIQLIPED